MHLHQDVERKTELSKDMWLFHRKINSIIRASPVKVYDHHSQSEASKLFSHSVISSLQKEIPETVTV